MADTATTLNVRLRDERGKGAARRMRREGRIPAVIYGHGAETRPVAVDAHELDRLFAHISIENTLIDLNVDGQDEVQALVREVQTHPFKAEVLHVDFYQVRAGETITLDVPIRVVGTAEGVKEGGVLDHRMHDLHIQCLPGAIPEYLELDITELEIGESLHVGDIDLPEGVETDVDPERTVCSVVPPSVLAVEEPEPEVPEGVAGEIEPELIGEEEAEEERPEAEGAEGAEAE